MAKGGVIIIKISDRANSVGFLLTSATNFDHDDLKKLLSCQILGFAQQQGQSPCR
jgi:hypothetical protein